MASLASDTTSTPLDFEDLTAKLDRETKIADGAEHLLKLLANDPTQTNNAALVRQVEKQLSAATENIRKLERLVSQARRASSSSRASEDQTTFTADTGPSGLPTVSPEASSTLFSNPGSANSRGVSQSLGASPSAHGRNSPLPALPKSSFESPPQWTSSSSMPLLRHKPSPDLPKADSRALTHHALGLLKTLRESSEIDGSSPRAFSRLEQPTQSPEASPRTPKIGSGSHHRSRRKASTSASGQTHSLDRPVGGGSSQDAAREDIERGRSELLLRLVSLLRKYPRVAEEIPAPDLVAAILPNLASSASTDTRASAYAALRHSLALESTDLMDLLRLHGLDLYLVRSLLRDNRSIVEKEQALKLIRTMMEVEASLEEGLDLERQVQAVIQQESVLTEGLIRAMIAASEHAEDKLRHVFLETLVELAILNLPLLLRAGGMGTILHALSEGSIDLAPAIAEALVYLADMPATRSCLRPGLDLEHALAGFTDIPNQTGIAYTERLQATAQIVGIMLRSWTGLLHLSSGERPAIASLVTALKVSPVEVQESIISVLVSIFDVGLGMESAEKRAKAKERNDLPEVEVAEGRLPQSRTAQEISRNARERNRQRIGLIDRYLSLLLVSLTEAGLVEACVHILQHSPEASRSATLLMGALLQVGSRVLPQSYNVHLHQLPSLFAGASKLNDLDNRQKALNALSAVDQASMMLQAQVQQDAKNSRKVRSDSLVDGKAGQPRQLQVEKVKMRMGLQIDDVTFRNLILETQVVNARDHTKWNLDGLFELLQGPLLNPKRLEETIRATKLLKRLIAFFHPSAGRFAELPATPSNRVYTTLGLTLLTTLLSTPEGIKFLAEDQLLKEIKEAFDQIESSSSSTSTTSDPVFAKSRITSTLSQGYLEMIGTLSASTEGSRLLGQFSIWTSLYRLCQSHARDDIIKVLMEKLDYGIDGHPRILLGWILTSSSRPLRRQATEYLARLIRRTPVAGEWKIALLLKQMGDPAFSIRDIAVAVIKEVSSNPQTLEMIVSLRPTLDHLGETGHELLLRFLSTPTGLRYLLEGDYIDREMEEWFHERSHRYAVQVEVNLSRAMSIHRRKDDASLEDDFDGGAPPHFYGELAKTLEGCHVLREKGHFPAFSDFIRQHGMEGYDHDILTQLKSVLWTVGNIGATAGGFPFLEEDGTVANIVDIAEHSPVLSVRGTCFYVIGLISTTRRGAELLQDYGWQSACTTFGDPTGICIPDRLDRFAQLPVWTADQSYNERIDLLPPTHPVHRHVLRAISDLSNGILANKASKSLSKLKNRHREIFEDLSLFVRALEMLSTFRLRAVVRKFIWDLFEVDLQPGTVRRIMAIRENLYEAARKRHQQRQGEEQSKASANDATTGRQQDSMSSSVGGRVGTGGIASISASSRRSQLLETVNPIEDAALEEGDEEDDFEDDYEEEEASDAPGYPPDAEDGEERSASEMGDFDETAFEPTSYGRSLVASAVQRGTATAIGDEYGTAAYGSLAPHTRRDSTAMFFVDDVEDHLKGARVGQRTMDLEPPKLAPAPAVRILGGFPEVVGSRRMSTAGWLS